jgi:alpha-tubulin suppressor-like RCC1 family protein
MKTKNNILLFISIFISISLYRAQPTWLKAECGTEFTVALKSDHTLWAWGFNANGQLGIGGTSNANPSPLQIGLDSDWSDISTGAFHALALKSNGTLWAWGSNGAGQLGANTTTQSNSPIQIGLASDWVSISTGMGHSFAIKSDSTLWGWGYNIVGQVGTGTSSNISSPTQIGTSHDWASISGGGAHSLGLKYDGSLWAWGANDSGQLGLGTFVDQDIPVQLDSLTNWEEIDAGFEYSLARKSDGTIWSWGMNGNGQLGDGTTNNIDSPLQIGTANDWITIEAGSAHAFAINSNHNLFGWGYSALGQIGNGGSTQAYLPEMIDFDTDWVSISAAKGGTDGVSVFGTHSAGLRGDKKVICMTGSNYQGQLGNSTTNDQTAFLCTTADLTLELQEISNKLESILIYPNPSNGIFRIETFDSKNNPTNYFVTDLTGQRLLKGSIQSATTEINLTEYPSGIYLFNLEKNDMIVTRKLFLD